MILQSLKELAEREELVQNPDYEPIPVKWILTVDLEGHFLGLRSTVTEQGAKRKPLPRMMAIPRRSKRTSGPLADFLVDKSEYVLGVEPDHKRTPADLAVRHRLFSDFVLRAANETRNPCLAAVAAFTTSDNARTAAADELAKEGYASNDLLAFEVQGSLVHELPQVQAYFSAQRHAHSGPFAHCLVCGTAAIPVEKHQGIKLRGGSTSGVALVSFNSDAFESYGWSRSHNATFCTGCADAYRTALTRLLSDRYPDPNHDGQVLPRRYVFLSEDTTAVFWADQASEVVDLFTALFDAPDPSIVSTLLAAPYTGKPPAELRQTFYCLILTGGQGRAILRSFHTGNVAEVENNVRQYFSWLNTFFETPRPLFFLLRSLAVQGKLENLSPTLAGDFFLAILFRLPFPRTLLSAAIQRCRAERRVSPERAAVITVYLNRNRKEKPIPMGLNPSETDPGYRLGRLLAVLEKLQAEAINPSSTIVDRYYGAASTRPATVFPALLKLAQHHTGKTRTPGRYQAQLGEVLEGLSRFPSTLNLEEQGLFALGYYHQRQEFYRRKPESESNEHISTQEKPENE